ncbi:uncharacterized protein LOC114519027 [Dendronephthya gigantea]|uniref:uncharacterized protein LOC114519027 n=1 Tax=Dendronephthya gigantea TaxID=151771 RepID=UPI00106DA5B1|nr:uncharacterized protein LOC114519027 [Dendronephthya gigantea]
MALQDATELTAFYQSKIEYAGNVSQSLHSSYNSSHSLVSLAKEIEENARREKEAISNAFVLAQKLKNDTADEKAATVVRNHQMVLDHIENQVTPIHEKCAAIQRDTRAILANTTATHSAAVNLLERVNNVSKEVDKTKSSYNALPSLNTKPLAGMISDITRIRDDFQALKLSSSIEKLRQGKNEQQKWLDEHKPRVSKLRQEVAAMQNLINSLKNIPCHK